MHNQKAAISRNCDTVRLGESGYIGLYPLGGFRGFRPSYEGYEYVPYLLEGIKIAVPATRPCVEFVLKSYISFCVCVCVCVCMCVCVYVCVPVHVS